MRNARIATSTRPRTRRHPALTASLSALALAAAPALARATDDTLRLEVRDQPSWAAAVAALQTDVHAEGRALHVAVLDAQGARLPCGEYALVPDPVAAEAFELGACAPDTRETELRLAHRTALFSHDDVIAHPRVAGISAVHVQRGAAAGGAGEQGGSDVRCAISVRPFLMDLERGQPVYLAPGRYALRPLAAGVSADVDTGGEGWSLRGSATSAAVAVEYEVVDTTRGAVVVHETATLRCERASLATGSAPALPPTTPPPPPPPSPPVLASPSSAPAPATARRTPFSVRLGFQGGVGYAPLAGMTLGSNGGALVPGSTYGLRAAWLGSAAIELALQGPWFSLGLAGGVYYAGVTMAAEVRLVPAFALRHERITVLAGPALRAWLLHSAALDGADVDSGVRFALGAQVGMRIALGREGGAGSGGFALRDFELAVLTPGLGDAIWSLGLGVGFEGGL